MPVKFEPCPSSTILQHGPHLLLLNRLLGMFRPQEPCMDDEKFKLKDHCLSKEAL